MEAGKWQSHHLSGRKEIPETQKYSPCGTWGYRPGHSQGFRQPVGEIPVKRFVIDTNVIISFITDRNSWQQEQASKLFEGAASLKDGILCHQHVLTEFIYVMDKIYRVPKSNISEIIIDFKTMPGIELANNIDFKQVFSYWPEHISDFGDAVIATVGMNAKNSVMVTFDRKFKHQLEALGLKCHQFPS
jgi:predicted nucleic-acid-binding protein